MRPVTGSNPAVLYPGQPGIPVFYPSAGQNIGRARRYPFSGATSYSGFTGSRPAFSSVAVRSTRFFSILHQPARSSNDRRPGKALWRCPSKPLAVSTSRQVRCESVFSPPSFSQPGKFLLQRILRGCVTMVIDSIVPSGNRSISALIFLSPRCSPVRCPGPGLYAVFRYSPHRARVIKPPHAVFHIRPGRGKPQRFPGKILQHRQVPGLPPPPASTPLPGTASPGPPSQGPD